jgi:hypothetical protein
VVLHFYHEGHLYQVQASEGETLLAALSQAFPGAELASGGLVVTDNRGVALRPDSTLTWRPRGPEETTPEPWVVSPGVVGPGQMPVAVTRAGSSGAGGGQ